MNRPLPARPFERLRCPSAYGDMMKRRSKAAGAAIKDRRRKVPKPERRDAPKAVARSNDRDETVEQ